MNRNAMSCLVAWKNDRHHRPLILRGARQVGKTWLMQAFGKQEYQKTAYIRFDHSTPLREIFEKETNVINLLQAIQLQAGFRIEPGKTLVIFDEIQECPGALASLKFFCEDAPEIDIVAAGSQLGLSNHVGTGFPVGKIDTQFLYPMSFLEFLDAIGKEEFAALIRRGDWKMLSAFHEEYIRLLKLYFVIGGMPKVVDSYVSGGDFTQVRRLQDELLLDYRSDFWKHASAVQTRRIEAVWDSIPAQLSRENKKFIFKEAQPGGRTRELEFSMLWLTESGLMRQINRVSKPDIPLMAYHDGAFKGFSLDIGLLVAQTGLPAKTILEGARIFEEFKGALTEQYVQQEIVAELGEAPHYWSSSRGDVEVDFLLQRGTAVIPVEVKASINVQAKSLKTYCGKFRPPVAVRTSLVKYYKQEQDFAYQAENTVSGKYTLIDLPLFAVSQIYREIDECQ